MPYHVYILSNHFSTVLYVGLTGDLEHRVYQHKKELTPGFTSKYNLDKLVYLEETEDVQEALAREKQLRGWRRSRKAELVETMNPE